MKAFSLIETIVTIVIYAMMLFMVTNIVLINARLSQELKMRSKIKNEMTELDSLIKRDIKNANSIDPTKCQDGACTINTGGTSVIWAFTGTSSSSITKVVTTGVSNVVDYATSSDISVDSLTFSTIVNPAGSTINDGSITVIFTINAHGMNPSWKVNNQLVEDVVTLSSYQVIK